MTPALDIKSLQPTWLWDLGEEDYPPPSIERQVKRMFCLAAQTIVSSTQEELRENANNGDAKDIQRFALDWISEQCQDEFTKNERELFDVPLENWDHQSLVNASWSFQAGGAIGWALGLTDWRPIWDSFGPDDFEFAFIETSVSDVIEIASPRLKSEIELKNSISCAYLWRARQEQFFPTNPFKRGPWKKFVAMMATETFKSGECPTPIDNDLQIDGSAYRKLPTNRKNDVQSRATERLRALNWLCGQHEDYDAISCDT